jgi:NADH dehydrogenase
LEYFRGKAELEEALRQSGIPHTILRPTVLFGNEDILINNIAWALRRFPVFGLFGDGQYKLQPIFVDDLARLAVEAGEHTGDEIVNAIGPETFRYRDLVRAIGERIGRPRPLIALPPALGHAACTVMGRWVGDVIVTRDEIAGLMSGLLEVDTPPTGNTRLTDWIKAHSDTLGLRYTSELARRTDRDAGYAHNR